MPVAVGAAQVPILRHHEGHRARLRCGEVMARERGADLVENPILRVSGECELRPPDRVSEDGHRRGRVVAHRPPDLRIPEIGALERCHPRPLHQTGEPVGAVDGGPVRPAHRASGPRPCRRSRTGAALRASAISEPGRHQVLRERHHPLVRSRVRPPRNPPAPIAAGPTCRRRSIEPGISSSYERSFFHLLPMHALRCNKSPAAGYVKPHSNDYPLSTKDRP